MKCPICKHGVTRESTAFPFCSERCRLVDLGGWLGEEYRVAGEESDREAEPDEHEEQGQND